MYGEYRSEGTPFDGAGMHQSAMRLELLGNRFTAISAVIVARQITVFAPFQFLVRMFTDWWINSLFPLRAQDLRFSLRHHVTIY